MSTLVTVEHVRIARKRHGGYCTKGMRVWAERNGLDFRHFLQHGYPIEVMQPVADAFMTRVIDIALEGER